MKKSFFTLIFGAILIANAHTSNLQKNGSNSYYKAIASVIFFGSDEIIGINKENSGFIDIENGIVKNGQITINATSFDTQNKKRDKHIVELLNAKTHSKIVFDILSQQEQNGQIYLNGNLSINGVLKQKQIPIKLEKNNGKFIISGQILVRYDEFDIELPTIGGFIKRADENIEIGGKFVFE